MASASDLDKLDHFLKGQPKTYDLPQLEINDHQTDFLTDLMTRLKEWLARLLEFNQPAATKIDFEFWKRGLVVATALLMIGSIGYVVHRYYRARKSRSSSATPSPHSLRSEIPFLPSTEIQAEQALDAWLRGRWCRFLAAQGLGLFLTPDEYLRQSQRLSPLHVIDLNRAMFSRRYPGRDREEWERLFQTWESYA